MFLILCLEDEILLKFTYFKENSLYSRFKAKRKYDEIYTY